MVFKKGHKTNIERKCKEETKEKIRLKTKEQWENPIQKTRLLNSIKKSRTEEVYKKISKSHMGLHPSEESKEKNRQAHIGKHPSEETKLKMSKNNAKHFKGKHFTEEHLNHLRESHLGQEPHNKRNDIRKKSKEIIKLYKDELLNCKEIGNKFSCNCATIQNILKENGVLMNQPERMKLLYNQRKVKVWNKDLTKENNSIIQEISKKASLRLKDKPLSEKHKKHVNEAREKLGIGLSTRFKKGSRPWNKGIPCSEETKRKSREAQLREKSHCWINGSSYEPYGEGWTIVLKNNIRNRDNQICMNCNKHREQMKEALQVHHINYDKTLCIPENLISLCRVCHGLTGKNREYWKTIFQEKLSKLYNYSYSNGNILLDIKTKTSEEKYDRKENAC
jgi:hypothetical protein